MDALTEDEEQDREEKAATAMREIKGELKWRMKNAKRRAVANAEGQVIGFNTSAFKETILDHNDPYKVEWTESTQKNDYFVGEKVILNTCIAKSESVLIICLYASGSQFTHSKGKSLQYSLSLEIWNL